MKTRSVQVDDVRNTKVSGQEGQKELSISASASGDVQVKQVHPTSPSIEPEARRCGKENESAAKDPDASPGRQTCDANVPVRMFIDGRHNEVGDPVHSALSAENRHGYAQLTSQAAHCSPIRPLRPWREALVGPHRREPDSLRPGMHLAAVSWPDSRQPRIAPECLW